MDYGRAGRMVCLRVGWGGPNTIEDVRGGEELGNGVVVMGGHRGERDLTALAGVAGHGRVSALSSVTMDEEMVNLGWVYTSRRNVRMRVACWGLG